MKSFSIHKLPDKLKRITSGGNVIGEIDGLRFLAIFPVVIQHLSERIVKYGVIDLQEETRNDFLFDFVTRGSIGVYIFFTISGFILALPFAKHYLFNSKKPILGKYYYRRITRLEPPYIVSLVLLFILLIINGEKFIILFPHLLASLFYVHAFIYGTWTPINPPSWTLEIEVQFYILAPLIALFYFKIGNAFLRRGLLISFIIIKSIIFSNLQITPRVFLSLAYSLEFFLLGFLILDLYLNKILIKRENIKYDILAIISFFGLFYSWSWENKLEFKLLFLIFLFVLFYSSFKGKYLNRFLRNRWISSIGGMCYTIYLIHLAASEIYIKFIGSMFKGFSFHSLLLIHSLIFLPILFVISGVFFLMIEKPCMDPKWPIKIKNYIGQIFK